MYRFIDTDCFRDSMYANFRHIDFHDLLAAPSADFISVPGMPYIPELPPNILGALIGKGKLSPLWPSAGKDGKYKYADLGDNKVEFGGTIYPSEKACFKSFLKPDNPFHYKKVKLDYKKWEAIIVEACDAGTTKNMLGYRSLTPDLILARAKQ